MKGITKVNTVIGIGKKIHKFVDANGKYVFLPLIYYHLPITDVELFFPKTYHQIHCEHSIMKGFNVQMVLNNHNIVIPISIQEANLPIIHNLYVTSEQKNAMGHY